MLVHHFNISRGILRFIHSNASHNLPKPQLQAIILPGSQEQYAVLRSGLVRMAYRDTRASSP